MLLPPSRFDSDKGSTYIIRVIVVSRAGGAVKKKLTITIDEAVYRGLYARIGAGRISSFIEELVRPHVLAKELEDAYATMARDRDREREALEWSEGLLGDAADDAR